MLIQTLMLLMVTVAFSLVPYHAEEHAYSEQHQQNDTRFNDTENLSQKIVDYLFRNPPRVEFEFQAMLYPFLLTVPDSDVFYEGPVNRSRIDFLIMSKDQCIVIQLKRNGNVDLALDQAKQYALMLLGAKTCDSICEIAINLNATNQIQFRGLYQHAAAYNRYLEIAKFLTKRVKKRFLEIPPLLI